MSFRHILTLIACTFIPGLELRASIPVGLFGPARDALGPSAVVAVCLVANAIVGMLVFELMGPAERAFRKWGWFDRKVWPLVERKREKLRPSVEKHGVWGVAAFIGIPLPGTGAYTGAVGAYLLKLDRRRFYAANFAGVLLACIAVTTICLLIDYGVVADDSLLSRVFLKR